MKPENARLRARILFIALAVAVVFWLPVEDQTPLAAQFFGVMGAAALGVRVFPFLHGRQWITHAGWGLACGLLVAPAAAALMVIKIGLHAHGGIPDFSPEDFLTVLIRTPIFIAGGILIATGVYLRTG